jgi:hypothetical protein
MLIMRTVSFVQMVLPLLALCGMASGSPTSSLELVKDGRPRAQIVISATPSRSVRLAARELQSHLEQISGAALPVTSEPAADLPVRVYVGRSRFTDELKIDTGDLLHGAFRVASGEDWLALVGRDDDFVPPRPFATGVPDRPRVLREWDQITRPLSDMTWDNPMLSVFKAYNPSLDLWEYDQRGSLNAVHDLLRSLGVRWYMPGDTILPRLTDVAVPRGDRTIRPDFAMRWYFFYRSFHRCTADEALWRLRLGLNSAPDLVGIGPIGHGIDMVHNRPETRASHPELFRLSRGMRETGQRPGDRPRPCLSSTRLFEENVKFVRAVLDHYGEAAVSVMPADGYSLICNCDQCRDKATPQRGYSGTLSDYVWEYVNRVAQEVYKTHPDRRIICFAYGSYLLPPQRMPSLSPNLLVGLCQWRCLFHDEAERQKHDTLRQQWTSLMGGAPALVYEYYLHARPRREYENVPALFTRQIARDLPALKGISHGEFIEVYQQAASEELISLATNHLNLYVTSRLYWESSQDVEAMRDEYLRLYYGPAESSMRVFMDYCESNWMRMRTHPAVIQEMFTLLEAAQAEAGPTVYGQRIALIAQHVAPLRQVLAQLVSGGAGAVTPDLNTAPKAISPARESGGFVIDGKLNEPMWEDLPKLQLWDLSGKRGFVQPTIFKLTWQGDALYLGIRVYDDDMARANIATRENDNDQIFNGDTIELLLATGVHSYYQIAINPGGALMDLDQKDGINPAWSAGAQVAVRREDKLWSVEMRLPIAGEAARDADPLQGVAGKKPTANEPWYFNLCRQRVREGQEPQVSAFSPTETNDFHVPAKFGVMWITEPTP